MKPIVTKAYSLFKLIKQLTALLNTINEIFPQKKLYPDTGYQFPIYDLDCLPFASLFLNYDTSF